MLVVPASVPGHVADLLDFNNPTCNISVLCMVLDTPQQPNWYGIAYRKGIQSFDSVNIFCHPHPGNAGMQDKDYQGRGGNWRHLFRYAQNLGMQLAPANSNQILVVPFFSNAVYHNGGIFAPNWREILTVAAIGVKASLGISSAFRSKIDLQVAAEAVRNHTTTTVVNNVVVSAFSYGRVLSATIRSAMPGLHRTSARSGTSTAPEPHRLPVPQPSKSSCMIKRRPTVRHMAPGWAFTSPSRGGKDSLPRWRQAMSMALSPTCSCGTQRPKAVSVIDPRWVPGQFPERKTERRKRGRD